MTIQYIFPLGLNFKGVYKVDELLKISNKDIGNLKRNSIKLDSSSDG